MATGASLALAAPASATVTFDSHSSVVSHNEDDWDWYSDNSSETNYDDSYNNNGDNRNNYTCSAGNVSQSNSLLPIYLSALNFGDNC
jgi:hypothetical protein